MSFDPQASQHEVEIKRSRHHAQKAKGLIEDLDYQAVQALHLRELSQIHATLSVAAATRAVALDPKDDA